jgi:hypothetical protein
MKKLLLSLCFILVVSTSFKTIKEPCAYCTSEIDKLEFGDLPSFEQGEWYESTDPWYGLHYTSVLVFSDGIRGKIFRGGTSGKHFIGGKTGGKFYFISQRATARALYLYKKHDCISTRYTQ